VIPVTQATEIAALEGVRTAVAIGQTTDKGDGPFGIRFVDAIPFDEYSKLTGIRIIEGSKLTGGNQSLVDPVWMKEHKAKLPSSMQLFERTFNVVGVYEPSGGARIRDSAFHDAGRKSATGNATAILVGCLDPAQQDA